MTVFVGPNNAGKSLVLSEIASQIYANNPAAQYKIVEGIEVPPISDGSMEALVTPRVLRPSEGRGTPGKIIVSGSGRSFEYLEAPFFEALTRQTDSEVRRKVLSCGLLWLNGSGRINHTNMQTAGDLLKPPAGTFQVILSNQEKRERLRGIVLDAFGSHLVVDPTRLGHLRLKLSSVAPVEDVELSIGPRALKFYLEALPIEETSDGVRAFVGIMTEVVAGEPITFLIDEPEAFLHPPLAFKLGQALAHSLRGTERRVFASTHSAAFLMGCVQSGVPVTIIRLTYRDGLGTARSLPSGELLTLMRDPLLRSAGVLNGLFYESVVIGEGDTDRAFYQEINERLLAEGKGRGVKNCLFLNAQNKQTVYKLMAPLRALGIPTAGIVDLDVVKEGGATWSNLLAGASVPEPSNRPLGDHRSRAKELLDKTKDWKRSGVKALAGDDKKSVDDLLDQLDSYGVFTVRVGEVERWLQGLGVPGEKTQWLIRLFESLGMDPGDPSYVHPGTGDVWGFLEAVSAWLAKPDRKGMPE